MTKSPQGIQCGDGPRPIQIEMQLANTLLYIFKRAQRLRSGIVFFLHSGKDLDLFAPLYQQLRVTARPPLDVAERACNHPIA
jgi:hypothetical protein